MAIMMTRPSKSWIHRVGEAVRGEAIGGSKQAQKDRALQKKCVWRPSKLRAACDESAMLEERGATTLGRDQRSLGLSARSPEGRLCAPAAKPAGRRCENFESLSRASKTC